MQRQTFMPFETAWHTLDAVTVAVLAAKQGIGMVLRGSRRREDGNLLVACCAYGAASMLP